MGTFSRRRGRKNSEGALKVFDRLLYNESPIGSLAHGGYSKNGESGTLSVHVRNLEGWLIKEIEKVSMKFLKKIDVTSFIAGCRALGLIDKFFTGPCVRNGYMLRWICNIIFFRCFGIFR